MKRPRVLLADDHSLILEGVRSILEVECDLVGTARDGRAVVDSAMQLVPDVIVMDISMPLLNGIEAARLIRKAHPRIRIVFQTMHANPEYLREALAVGASGYLLKTSAREELPAALRRVMDGALYVSPGFGEEIVAEFKHRPESFTSSQTILTGRQREILQLVAEGRSAKQIAHLLNISLQTVAFHKYQIMNRLGVRTTAELTAYALRSGML